MHRYRIDRDLLELPSDLASLQKLTRLELHLDASGPPLPNATFDLPRLEHLIIHAGSESGLVALPNLAGLKKLHTLRIDCATLRHISGLEELDALRVLDLRRLPWTLLPDALFRLTRLRELTLQDVPIQQLPSEIGRLGALRELRMIGHQLETIPAQIGLLTHLRSLVISRGAGEEDEPLPLRELPAELGLLTSLQELDVGGALIVDIPEELATLRRLTRLMVRDNPISTLPNALRRLPLELLDVGGTRLTELPPCVFAMGGLKKLRLSGCTFDEGGYRDLERLMLPTEGIELPAKRTPPRAGPRVLSAKPLTRAVTKQLRRLGIDVPRTAPIDRVRIRQEELSVPVAICQLDKACWPGPFTIEDLKTEVHRAQWGDIEGYEITANAPFVAIAHDQHRGYWVIRIDDRKPENPKVYRLAHDDYDVARPGRAISSLSAFLQRLSPLPT